MICRRCDCVIFDLVAVPFCTPCIHKARDEQDIDQGAVVIPKEDPANPRGIRFEIIGTKRMTEPLQTVFRNWED